MIDDKQTDKITVCVIDSMIDMKCEGINTKKLSVIPYFSSKSALVFKESNGHGNAVCSLIHNKNRNAEIILFPVDHSDSPDKITQILRFILENHLSRIVNISLGFYKYTDSIRKMEDTCNELLKNGIFVVAACPQDNVYPGGFKSVIGVTIDKCIEDMIFRCINGKVYVWLKNEPKTLWWRRDYVIREYGSSFATAEVTGMLSKYICDSECENKIIKELWQLMKRIQ